MSAKAKSVNFAVNDCDLEVALLGEAGWHTRAIARETGLTESQVQYRLSRAGIKRADYRNGTSAIADFIVGVVRHRDQPGRQVHLAANVSDKFETIKVKCVASATRKRRKN